MDFHTALAFGLPIGLGITSFGVALALGRAVTSAMDSVGRQPEAMTKILIVMLTGCAFIEAIAIYGLVFAFSLVGKI